MVNPIVYRRLVQVAKARGTVTLADLGTAADLVPGRADDGKILLLVLDHVAEHEAAEARPLLPAVVVREDGQPGVGLAGYARRKGLITGDDPAFFAAELERVYAHWAPAARRRGP